MIRLAIALLALILIFFLAFTFKKTIDKLMPYAGILIPVISAIFVIACLPDILNGTASDATWFVFAIAATGLVTGLRLLWDERRTESKISTKQSEREVLHVIGRNGGRVTPIDIAMATDLTVEEAEQKLDAFCDKDIGERKITPNGKIVYVFPGFITDDEKKQAQDPMDVL